MFKKIIMCMLLSLMIIPSVAYAIPDDSPGGFGGIMNLKQISHI